MLGLDSPDRRRALRSIVQAVVALVIVGLVGWIIHLLRTEVDPLYKIALALLGIVFAGTVFYGWIIHLLRTEVDPLYKIALALLGIVFAGTVFYGAENVTRAVKIKAGILEAGIGEDADSTGS